MREQWYVVPVQFALKTSAAALAAGAETSEEGREERPLLLDLRPLSGGLSRPDDPAGAATPAGGVEPPADLRG